MQTLQAPHPARAARPHWHAQARTVDPDAVLNVAYPGELQARRLATEALPAGGRIVHHPRHEGHTVEGYAVEAPTHETVSLVAVYPCTWPWCAPVLPVEPRAAAPALLAA